MSRFKSEHGVDSEEFDETMRYDAGPVECWKCKIKIGQGNKGMSMNICKECIGYFCNDHIERHDNCSEGR